MTRFRNLGFFMLAVMTNCAAASDEVISACQRISGNLASVSFDECTTLQMKPSGYRSVDGFPLLIKEYPPLQPRKPKGRVLLVGGTHGDELSSISVVFKWSIPSKSTIPGCSTGVSTR